MTPRSAGADRLVIGVEDVTSEESRRLLAAYVAEIEGRWQARIAAAVATGEPVPPGSPLPERVESTLVPPDGLFLVARRDVRVVGCVGLRLLPAEAGGRQAGDQIGQQVGEVKRMYVPPDERGSGAARALLAAVEAQARQRGFVRLRLDTRGDLVEAQQLYRSAGYREIPRYNANPYAEQWFEKVLGRPEDPRPNDGRHRRSPPVAARARKTSIVRWLVMWARGELATQPCV